MQTSTSVDIAAPSSVVWEIVTDIEGSERTIDGIEKIEILERTEDTLLGLKWRETRTLFGRTAQETMWVTSVDEGRSYSTEAHSHGAIYRTRIEVTPADGGSRLEMTFSGEPQTLAGRIMATVLAPLMRKSITKMCAADLADIKREAESRAG